MCRCVLSSLALSRGLIKYTCVGDHCLGSSETRGHTKDVLTSACPDDFRNLTTDEYFGSYVNEATTK